MTASTGVTEIRLERADVIGGVLPVVYVALDTALAKFASRFARKLGQSRASGATKNRDQAWSRLFAT